MNIASTMAMVVQGSRQGVWGFVCDMRLVYGLCFDQYRVYGAISLYGCYVMVDF